MSDAQLRQAFAAARRDLGLDPDPPRFRYFQKRNGPMFSWTTEKFEGRYGSFVHVPDKKGEWWTLDEDSISAHALRKDAKARALRLYQAWLDGEPRPWL